MRAIRIVSLLVLFTLLALTAGVRPAAAQGPPCGLHPGACFLDIGEGEPFFLFDDPWDGDGDGDVDYILYFTDGHSDFWTQLPNGKLFGHANEQNTEIIYCPFFPFDGDGNFVAPDERCVYGEGNVSVNGFYEEYLFLCPTAIVLQGSGWRASDGAPFEFAGRFVTAMKGSGSGCTDDDIVQFEITDTMP